MRNCRIGVVGLLLLVLSACDAPGSTLSPASATDKDALVVALVVLNRTDYIDPTLYEAFTREMGVKVVELTYDDDTELLAQLRAPTARFDVLVASERNVVALRRDNKLAALNRNNIANFQNVEARLQNLPFDPNNLVSAPYVWGAIGLLYRTDKLPAVDSWTVLFDPSRNTGKVAVLEEPRAGLGAALKWLGLSLNSTAATELTRARDAFVKQRANIRFDSAAWSDALLTGEVAVAQARSEDAAFTQFTNANLRYAIPREGAPLWMDNFTIPISATHTTQAAQFINFMLRAENAARSSAHTFALSPIVSAYDKMEASKAALFRSGYISDDATFKKSEFVADVGAAQAEYERVWIELNK